MRLVEDDDERVVGIGSERVLGVGRHPARDLDQLVGRVVGEVDLAGEPRPEARVRVEELVHQVRVASDDHDEFVAVVLHPLDERLDCLGAEVEALRPGR